MQSENVLSSRVPERNALIQKARELLEADGRISATWVAGSIGRGDADLWSDVDLWVVVRDKAMPEISEGRRRFVGVLGDPLLISEAPQNAPPGGAYLLVLYSGESGPQHVDWNWLPLTSAILPLDAVLLFSKVDLPVAVAPISSGDAVEHLEALLTQECAFFWAMTTVVAKYIARRRQFETLNLLNITASTLSKVRWLLGEGTLMTYRDNAWSSASAPWLPAEQFALLRTLAATMLALHPDVLARGGEVPLPAIPSVMSLFALVEERLK